MFRYNCSISLVGQNTFPYQNTVQLCKVSKFFFGSTFSYLAEIKCCQRWSDGGVSTVLLQEACGKDQGRFREVRGKDQGRSKEAIYQFLVKYREAGKGKGSFKQLLNQAAATVEAALTSAEVWAGLAEVLKN